MDTALLVDHETQLGYIVLAPETQDASSHSVNVICCHGSGHGRHAETWLPLVREISKRVPVLFYERRYGGQSTDEESYMQKPEEAARDLTLLLRSRQLQPPYILVAHSYGGAVAREFLQDHKSQVAGMVLAETGLETPVRHEQEQYKRQILGARPLSVIHANSLFFSGPGAGNPTAEQRRLADLFAKEDVRLKKAQLRLSSNSRYVRLLDCGHNVVRDRPDVVAEEVDWVINSYANIATNLSKPSFGSFLMPLVRRLFRFRMPSRDNEEHHKT